MNVTGQIGEFIVKYQNYIEIGAIALAVVVLIAIVVRAVKNSKKKRELLSKINDAVTEINSTVNTLSQKKSEVIYIDNRVPGSIAEQQKNADVHTAATAEAAAAGVGEAQRDAEANAFDDGEKPESVKKYFDRDCAVSKSGRVYTEEELQERIKE